MRIQILRSQVLLVGFGIIKLNNAFQLSTKSFSFPRLTVAISEQIQTVNISDVDPSTIIPFNLEYNNGNMGEDPSTQLQPNGNLETNGNYYYEDWEPYYEEEDWGVYNEHDTSFPMEKPSLDMLKEWTNEYLGVVDLAGGMTRVSLGVAHMLADEFVFTSPTMGPMNKNDYIALMKHYNDNGLDLASAVPDLKVTYDGWHQDPHEPWRIWAVARYSGTHIGTVVVPHSNLKLIPPSNGERPVRFTTGPELQSFLWTEDKKILWQTVGFVGDEYTGSNEGHGGLEGLLVSMGLPRLYLLASAPFRRAQRWLSQFRNEQTDPKSQSPYSSLPQWWHQRKTFRLNIHR